MKSYTAHGISLVLTLLPFGLTSSVNAQVNRIGPAEATLTSTARAGKYSFVLFWKLDDQATQSMRQQLQIALSRYPARATVVSVQLTDPAEQAVVERFSVRRSPMPLVVAMAPNGAITGGFPLKISDAEVSSAFVSPGMARSLKGLQSRKLVLLCVQPAQPGELPPGVREFCADPQYSASTEVVSVRGDDPAEAPFLKSLKIQPRTATFVTGVLVPPGQLLGTVEGAVSKQQIIDKLKAAQGCCPGGKCGPGGCCPK